MAKWPRKARNSHLRIRLWGLLLLLITATVACRQTSPGANLASDTVKILVAESGFYRLTPPALQDAGLDIGSFTDDNLYLSQGETAVPYLIAEDSLIFYGQASEDRYTAVRPYLLQTGRAGLTMAKTAVVAMTTPQLNQVPQTLRLEENHIYEAQARTPTNTDLWFWQTLGLKTKIPLNFELPAGANGPGHVQINLWGVSHSATIENDHDFDLLVNDQKINTVSWDGRTHFTAQSEIPATLLAPGDNTITLDNTAAGAAPLDIMQLNWLELVYMAAPVANNGRLQFTDSEGLVTLRGFNGRPHLFDISNPDVPTVLSGWEMADGEIRLGVQRHMDVAAIDSQGYRQPVAIEPLRQSSWRSPAHQADLIIIASDQLAPPLAPLIAAREAQGLSVALVPAAEIYDEFGAGAATPQSIQAFVAYAYEKWQPPRPRYLFIVGDATSDYRNYLGQASPHMIPSPMVAVQFSGETVSDARLADVDGDMRPELAIGRWPAGSREEVANLVERTLAYEQGTAGHQAIFAADGSESRFATIARDLWAASNFRNQEITLLNGPQATDVAAQWNQGAWLTTYIGHGSVQQWGKDDIFTPETVKELQATTPPIVVQLTCLTGLFAHPKLTSLSETMLAHERGPVLIIAATSLTLSNHQKPFALALLQNLHDPSFSRIGDALQQARLSLDIEGNDGLREISDTFSLFGDPSTPIIRPNA